MLKLRHMSRCSTGSRSIKRGALFFSLAGLEAEGRIKSSGFPHSFIRHIRYLGDGADYLSQVLGVLHVLVGLLNLLPRENIVHKYLQLSRLKVREILLELVT